ncbi:MAG: signal peptidase I [Firmicutes bacterium]|nr:signal peptidase I [Bacillota bacterium]MBR2748260.1 signal peptidase I [Bacillota bacterium]
MENEKKQKSKLGEFLRDVIIALVLATVILLLFKPVIVKQHSMEPNFYGGDYLIVSRQAYSIFGDPATGDIIVFKTELTDEEGNHKSLIKRIIGCPGDTLEIRAGYVYLNGELLDEPYLMDQGLSGEMDQVTIPEGMYFCCGDNRAVSNDSRGSEVGLVAEEDIIGKVVLRLYPFDRISTF